MLYCNFKNAMLVKTLAKEKLEPSTHKTHAMLTHRTECTHPSIPLYANRIYYLHQAVPVHPTRKES